MLERYNPGRSTSLYCLASALMSIESLKKAVQEIENTKEDKAKTFWRLIQELAEKEKISLKLRK